MWKYKLLWTKHDLYLKFFRFIVPLWTFGRFLGVRYQGRAPPFRPLLRSLIVALLCRLSITGCVMSYGLWLTNDWLKMGDFSRSRTCAARFFNWNILLNCALHAGMSRVPWRGSRSGLIGVVSKAQTSYGLPPLCLRGTILYWSFNCGRLRLLGSSYVAFSSWFFFFFLT